MLLKKTNLCQFISHPSCQLSDDTDNVAQKEMQMLLYIVEKNACTSY
jgi:hypothetical protein